MLLKALIGKLAYVVWLFLMIAAVSFAYAQVVVPEGNVAFVIASDDDVTPTLTSREDAVAYKLRSLGYTNITYISPVKLAGADFSKARLVISTEEKTLDANTVKSLIESGRGVVLLYNAASSLGGTWNSSYGSDWGSIYLEKDASFLKGYAADLPFQVQISDHFEKTAFSIQSNYPIGWTLLGRVLLNWSIDYKTAFYREHANGGKGVIFTYNPQYYTEMGENVFAKIVEWVAKPPIVLKGVTVPKGNVAFVIAGTTLTKSEATVSKRLEALGYQITYIPFSKLKASDLSKAKFVAGVEYPSLDSETINLLIENGQSVVLFYKASAPLGGKWGSGGSSLYVEKGEAFLEGYAPGISFDVGNRMYINKYPLDWITLGGTGDVSQKTALYREHASSGRSVIFTYDPGDLTWRGESVFNAIIQWVNKSLTVTGVKVPDGDVAFVITHHDEVVLTDKETVVSDKLKALGYKITYICLNRVAVSDLSKARFIIATETPTLESNTINALIQSGMGVTLLYNAASFLGGTWNSSYGSDWGSIYLEKDASFLKGYAADLPFQVQISDHFEKTAFSIQSNYPIGWTLLGRVLLNWSIDYKTAFYREHANGGKGVIFTYNPQYYTERGENVFAKIIEWVAKPPIVVKGVTVPKGNVAFVISGRAEPVLILSSTELNVSKRLESSGYQITYVPFSKLKASDLSKAKFVIGTEYPSLDSETINSLVEAGKGVALLYNSAGTLGGSWGAVERKEDYKLVVSKGEAFLEGYKSGATLDVQSKGYASYIYRGYPLEWTILGVNTENIANATAFYKQHASGGRGAIFTYYPEYYAAEGESIFKKIVKWVEEVTPTVKIPALPIPVSPADAATVETLTLTLQWQASEHATSYSVQVAKDDKFTDIVVTQTGISTATYAIPSGKLEDGKTYYWRVKSLNAAGESGWSVIQSFTVKITTPETGTIVKLKTPDGPISKEGTFSVQVLVDRATNLAGFELDLAFDPKLLEATEALEGDFLKSDKGNTNWQPPQIDNAKGLISGAVSVRTSAGGLTGSGSLAKITFKAKAAGESPLTLQDVVLSDAAAQKIQHTVQSGSVTITDITPILIKIEPSSQEVNKGRQFTVSITVEGAKGLAGFQMGFKYNPAVLEVVEVKEGDFLKGGGGGTNWLPPTIDNKTGIVSGITGVRTSPGGVDGVGIIATLTLKAIAKGESPITLQGVLLSDLAAKKIPSVTQDAQVKVISPSFPAWDVNQDGVVNIFDFVLIGQHFGESPPKDARADVNADGVVNIFDSVLVGQHFGETTVPAAASVWAMDYAQHLSALRELYGLIATQPNSSEVLELKQLLNRLIALAESQIIPSASALGQNYPNPFNPETWLPYQLSEASKVTITIYDTQGRVIRRIDLGYQQAGLYRARTRAAYWDGRNEVGEPVASGVYFYELAAERFRAGPPHGRSEVR